MDTSAIDSGAPRRVGLELEREAMLTVGFALGCLALFVETALFPELRLHLFAPWIVLVALQTSLPKTLWLSAAAGAIIDLLSDEPMGLHAISTAACGALLYRMRHLLSIERPLHLSLASALASLSLFLLQLCLLFLFDRRAPFVGKWTLGDLLGMSLADGVYALVWFWAPLSLFTKLRRMWVLFWLKRKSLSPTSP